MTSPTRSPGATATGPWRRCAARAIDASTQRFLEALTIGRQTAAAPQRWGDRDRAAAVVEPAVRAARTASAVLEQTTNLSVSVIVGQIRSTAVDLLRSTGMSPDDARARIRATRTPH